MIIVLQFILVVRFKRLLEGRRVEALSSHICVTFTFNIIICNVI